MEIFVARVLPRLSPVACFLNQSSKTSSDIYILLAGWEVRIVKNCDWGLENAASRKSLEIRLFYRKLNSR